MDQETTQRLEALEARVLRLEGQPVAALEVTETKPKVKRVTNRKPLTPEQKLEHVDRLRKGKLAARARREAEAKTSPEVPATIANLVARTAAEQEAQAEVDARADMAVIALPEDAIYISENWDAISVQRRTKIAKAAGIEGKVGSSTWESLPETDKKAIIIAQNAKKGA